MKILNYTLYSGLFLLIVYIILMIADYNTVVFLAEEDGLFESGTAVWFALAGIVFIYLYKKDSSGNSIFKLTLKKNIFLLLLGLLFIVGAGEEISWGQRIFDIPTPEALKESNYQGELNIHNLFSKKYHKDAEGLDAYLNIDFIVGKLFSLFWLTLCVLIPVFDRYSTKFSTFIRKLNIPIVPISIGILFLANHGLSKFLEFINQKEFYHFITETKEHNFAFLFFVISIWFLNSKKKTTNIS